EKVDLVAQRPLPPKSSMADVFKMPEAKPKQSRWVGYAGKIAAGIAIVFATWYGASSIRLNRSLQLRATIPSTSTSAPSLPFGPATACAGKTESKGTIARLRESIASRAAAQITDNLRDGMEAWGAAARSYPAGWSRSLEGYMHPGAL